MFYFAAPAPNEKNENNKAKANANATEKVVADMGGGRQLLIDIKNCGDGDDHPDRVHVLLIHETAMSVTESGVMVSM